MPKELLTGTRQMMCQTPNFLYTGQNFALLQDQVIEGWNGGIQLNSNQLEFYIRQEISLGGISAEELAVFPGAWDVQEITLPYGRPLLGKVNNEANKGATQQQVEIHDIWTTQEIPEDKIFSELFSTSGGELGPSFLDVPQGTASLANYLTTEQVIAGRSRVFQSNRDTGNAGQTADFVKDFAVKIMDQVWGSGEPIASDVIHHVRAVRFYTDSGASYTPEPGSYMVIPASNQPMMVEIAEPNFLSYYTMLRRNLDV